MKDEAFVKKMTSDFVLFGWHLRFSTVEWIIILIVLWIVSQFALVLAKSAICKNNPSKAMEACVIVNNPVFVFMVTTTVVSYLYFQHAGTYNSLIIFFRLRGLCLLMIGMFGTLFGAAGFLSAIMEFRTINLHKLTAFLLTVPVFLFCYAISSPYLAFSWLP